MFNMLAANFLTNLVDGFNERLSYSIKHMSVPQWGIITLIALTMGIVMMRSNR